MEFKDNTKISLEETLLQIKGINSGIQRFNTSMDELWKNLNNLMDTSKKEELAYMAVDVNDALIEMNSRYREFLEGNNITNELVKDIRDINDNLHGMANTISTVDQNMNDLEKNIVMKNKNIFKKFSKEIDETLNESIEKNNEILVNSIESKLEYMFLRKMDNIKKDLLEEISGISRVSDNVILNSNMQTNYQSSNVSRDSKGNIYYISKINGNKVHVYNEVTGKEKLLNYKNSDNELVSVVPSIKIAYIDVDKNNQYLFGISKSKRNLYSLEINSGKHEVLLRYCIDFIRLGDFIYALVQNNIIKIKLGENNPVDSKMLIDSNYINNGSKGSICSIGNNKLFVNFNEYNFIVNSLKLDVISLL